MVPLIVPAIRVRRGAARRGSGAQVRACVGGRRPGHYFSPTKRNSAIQRFRHETAQLSHALRKGAGRLQFRIVGDDAEAVERLGQLHECLIIVELEAVDSCLSGIGRTVEVESLIVAVESVVSAKTDLRLVAKQEVGDVFSKYTDGKYAGRLEIVFERDVNVVRVLRA